MSAHLQLDSINQSIEVDVLFFPPQWEYAIAPTLTTLATALVMCQCIISKIYKSPMGAMIFWINLAEFTFCITKPLGVAYPYKNSAYCALLGGISSFGALSSVIWGALFGHALMTITTYNLTEIGRRNLRAYILFAVILPLVLGIVSVPMRYLQYSETKKTCVHRLEVTEIDWSYAILRTIPIMSSVALSLIWYILAGKRLLNTKIANKAKYLLTILIYPAITFCCWVPSITVNVLLMHSVSVSETITMIGREISQFQGFLNALIYMRYERWICCCWWRAQRENMSVRGSIAEVDGVERSKTQLRMSSHHYEIFPADSAGERTGSSINDN